MLLPREDGGTAGIKKLFTGNLRLKSNVCTSLPLLDINLVPFNPRIWNIPPLLCGTELTNVNIDEIVTSLLLIIVTWSVFCSKNGSLCINDKYYQTAATGYHEMGCVPSGWYNMIPQTTRSDGLGPEKASPGTTMAEEEWLLLVFKCLLLNDRCTCKLQNCSMIAHSWDRFQLIGHQIQPLTLVWLLRHRYGRRLTPSCHICFKEILFSIRKVYRNYFTAQ